MHSILMRLAEISAVLAQPGDGKETTPEAPSGINPIFILLIALFFVFYFIVLRPQKREQTQRKAMLAGIKKNDRVLTIGGIYGVVTNVQRESDELTLKVDEATNTKLRVTLSSVARVVGAESEEETPGK